LGEATAPQFLEGAAAPHAEGATGCCYAVRIYNQN